MPKLLHLCEDNSRHEVPLSLPGDIQNDVNIAISNPAVPASAPGLGWDERRLDISVSQ